MSSKEYEPLKYWVNGKRATKKYLREMLLATLDALGSVQTSNLFDFEITIKEVVS